MCPSISRSIDLTMVMCSRQVDARRVEGRDDDRVAKRHVRAELRRLLLVPR